ncbi:hypothetical protein [Salinarchaeum sp. Harcht-Bsk1]|uniref:hypothetical protein n=1 Tax=Salinarchaeum sp. Harcht-Bsk1 TaxID=1333523 RepID=UPI001651A8F4|nr:hypothetical protein [Salinarchaeum sp. Harcht-Bsk1]
MTIDATGGGMAGSAVINSSTCAEDTLAAHLRAALERTEDPAARFHIREALQLLAAE